MRIFEAILVFIYLISTTLLNTLAVVLILGEAEPLGFISGLFALGITIIGAIVISSRNV